MPKTVNIHGTDGRNLTEVLPRADIEPYVRSTDDARMIAIAPGTFVNEAVWKLLGALR